MARCETCGASVKEADASVCPYCGTALNVVGETLGKRILAEAEASRLNTERLLASGNRVPGARTGQVAAERELFRSDGILITSSRVVVGGSTFPVAHITKVGAVRDDRRDVVQMENHARGRAEEHERGKRAVKVKMVGAAIVAGVLLLFGAGETAFGIWMGWFPIVGALLLLAYALTMWYWNRNLFRELDPVAARSVAYYVDFSVAGGPLKTLAFASSDEAAAARDALDAALSGSAAP